MHNSYIRVTKPNDKVMYETIIPLQVMILSILPLSCPEIKWMKIKWTEHMTEMLKI